MSRRQIFTVLALTGLLGGLLYGRHLSIAAMWNPASRTVNAADPYGRRDEKVSRPDSFDRFDFSISDKWLQLALFDPCDDDPEPLRIFGLYPDTPEARDYLSDVLNAFRRYSARRPDVAHCLGVFPAKVSA